MRRVTMILRACHRCGGAAYLEDPQEEDWRCLQCGRTVPAPDIESKKSQRAA